MVKHSMSAAFSVLVCDSFMGHKYQPTPLKEQEHFGGLSTGGLAVRTRYYVRDVDFSSVDVQKSLEEVGAEILTLKGINQERKTKSLFSSKRFDSDYISILTLKGTYMFM